MGEPVCNLSYMFEIRLFHKSEGAKLDKNRRMKCFSSGGPHQAPAKKNEIFPVLPHLLHFFTLKKLSMEIFRPDPPLPPHTHIYKAY